MVCKILFLLVYFGEILCEEFMKLFGFLVNVLVIVIGVIVVCVNEIVNEWCGIIVDIVLCLVVYFGMDVQSWMNL